MAKKIPNVKEIFSGEFPEGFGLEPTYWVLPEGIVSREDIETEIRGEKKLVRPIGTMDVEFLSNELVEKARKGELDLVRNYPCGLKCPGCFSEDTVYGDKRNLMTWQDTVKVLADAKKIGLYSVKFLGPGEFLQNPDAFDILDALKNLDIKFAIFTKGVETAVDELAREFHGRRGIKTGEDLVKKLAEYDGISILQHMVSFDEGRQNRVSGSKGVVANYSFDRGKGIFLRGVPGYTDKRNRAIELWTEYGFNDPAKGQRLTLVATPMDIEQIDEAPGMYIWSARRNIPLVMAPTMESGKGAGLKNRDLRHAQTYFDGLIDLYTAVYSAAINEGITTVEKLNKEGLSSYIGTAPCSQVANGLMMRLNGRIQMCPGPDRSSPGANYGSIGDKPIAEHWVDSPHYNMGRQMNNWCTAKTEILPGWIRQPIRERLGERYG